MPNKKCLICFFFLFFLIIIGVTVICLIAKDGIKHEETYPFWQRTIVYQVYPRSFCDHDGDGTGDLQGILSKADYLKELGVGTVWLSPIFSSPMADFGYDVANFTAIEPLFGTMEDFDALRAALHDRGLRLVLDFVPNHSSDEHEWFVKSRRKEEPYTDYYIWADPKGFDEEGQPIPPNNWLSVFRGPAWTWAEERQQFYFHQFLAKQPDLNYRNQRVREEMMVRGKSISVFEMMAVEFMSTFFAQLGNHDNGRVGSRFGEDLVDALNMLILLLPGTPVTYYGEEIGMLNTFISWEDTQDPQACNHGLDGYEDYSRDPERTPMQWDNSTLAGFTTGNSTWLPVNDNYKELNVKAQQHAEKSHLKIYEELARLRKEETFTKGLTAYPVISNEVFTLLRYLEGYESYLLVINTSEEELEVDLHQHANMELPPTAEVVLRSVTDTAEETVPGSEIHLSEVKLVAGEGLLLTFTE
ncbi:maltase 1-like [Penaeus indicus]|uniref:maltase 1-like n=1 Tax=Penaeus indicus TaxID=29960 RepID=UPI00300D46E8